MDAMLETRREGLERLVRTAGERGGPSAAELDFSPESLVALWTWATAQLAEAPEAPDRDRLPAWLNDAPWYPGERFFREDDYWLLDGVIWYLVETIFRNVPGAKWELWDEPGNATHNRAVVRPSWPPLDPVGFVHSYAGTATFPLEAMMGRGERMYLGPPEPDPQALLHAFERVRDDK